ncbi:MAG: sulfotransferase family 2 domain-containing protein, partial [Pseudomonadota bacterium]
IAAAKAPLLFAPMKAGPEAEIAAWMAQLDGVAPADLTRNFNQKQLRQWKRARAPHRSFTVLRHPVARAYRAFQDKIVGTGKGSFLEIRKTLMRVYNVSLEADGPGADWTADRQRAAFLEYLAFVKMNLSGQTAVRVDGTWATQAQSLQGFADFAVPDMVLREDTLDRDLGLLCAMVGLEAPAWQAPEDADQISLADIYDAEVEAAVADVYQRDYMTFGFGTWA